MSSASKGVCGGSRELPESGGRRAQPRLGAGLATRPVRCDTGCASTRRGHRPDDSRRTPWVVTGSSYIRRRPYWTEVHLVEGDGQIVKLAVCSSPPAHDERPSWGRPQAGQQLDMLPTRQRTVPIYDPALPQPWLVRTPRNAVVRSTNFRCEKPPIAMFPARSLSGRAL